MLHIIASWFSTEVREGLLLLVDLFFESLLLGVPLV